MSFPRSIAHLAAAFALALPLAAPAQSNTDITQATKAQLKQERKANKAQAHADKKRRKALDTHEQKEADKAQDKADRKAAEVSPSH